MLEDAILARGQGLLDDAGSLSGTHGSIRQHSSQDRVEKVCAGSIVRLGDVVRNFACLVAGVNVGTCVQQR